MAASAYVGALTLVMGLSAFMPGDSHFNVIELLSQVSHAVRVRLCVVCGVWCVLSGHGMSRRSDATARHEPPCAPTS